MVGVFSRFSGTKAAAHKRPQTSLLGEREALPTQNSEAAGASAPTTTTTIIHGIELTVEFKPVEHPVEPIDNDMPIQCPLQEPSILNDGRIWRERVSAVRGRIDMPVMEEGTAIEPEAAATKSNRPMTNRPILPSISAPEHSILKLLEETGI